MIARRTALLARCFRLVGLGLGASLLGIACDNGSSLNDPSGAGDAPDASAALDATLGDDASLDARSDRDAGEAAVVSCWAISTIEDAGPDAEEICHFVLPCGLSNETLTHVGCQVVPSLGDGGPADPKAVGFPYCHLLEGKGCTDGGYAGGDGAVELDCIGCPGGGGRRPAGFARSRSRGACPPIGAYFESMAELESASIHAFARMARELTAHGAPSVLVDEACASARDEARHERRMTRLARRFGGSPRAPSVRATGTRSLASIARENAVEGCVRETFGALVNAWQAEHARDAEVRAAMQTIARDELRHAALSWEIDAWIARRLTPSERRTVARARRRAVGRLVAEVARTASGGSAQRALLGLPDASSAQRLARGLADRLWA